ncbi:MAG TPA: restriction endonuclease [Pseudonocardiaceae bacterium]|jgi:hypothetical protein|nr:restriction endonuclease [Pseudonocardiaceae bacterium]
MNVQMRESGRVLMEPSRWKQVVRQYADLETMDGITPQARGQQFNTLIADLLTASGIAAKPNVRNVGELDVTFSFDGKYYILEAKWEQRKTGTGPIAKLQRRVEQRMSGVTGVFLAMKGYTDEALGEIDKGRRLDVILLDRGHWDAMVGGIVPASELLKLALEAASFQGRAYIPLTELVSEERKESVVSFPSAQSAENLLTRGESDLPAQVVVDGIESRYVDLTVGPDGTLFLTVDHGVLAVDSRRQQASWATSISGCTSAVGLPDGTVMACRGEGVSRYRDGTLTAVLDTAGEPIQSRLLARFDGSTWCLRDGSPSAGLLRLDSTANQHWIPVQAPAGPIVGAAWLTPSEVIIADQSELMVVSTDSASSRRIDVSGSAVVGLARVDDGKFVTVHANGDVRLTEVEGTRQLLLGQLQAQAYCGIGVDPQESRQMYLAARYRDGSGRDLVAILQVRLPDRWKWAVARRTPAPEVVRTATSTAGATAADPREPRVPDTTRPAREVVEESLEQRSAHHERGRRDGRAVAMRLPMEAFASLAMADFDLPRWLEPGRESWRLSATKQAPAGSALPAWFPQFARYLGQYAAPTEALEGHFKPPAPYVIGFGAGLREVWESAAEGKLVPHSAAEISYWLHEPSSLWRQQTIHDLRNGVRRVRGKAAARSTAHVLLWIGTAFAGLLELGAIGAAASGGFPNGGDAIGANVFFGLVFLTVLFFALSMPRRIRDRRSRKPAQP